MKKNFTFLKAMLIVALFGMFRMGANATDYTENFSVAGNWTGGSMTGYNAKTYTNSSAPGNLSFSTNAAVRESSNTSSTYAFRVDDLAGAYFRAECSLTDVSGFTVSLARWDNKPTPSVTIRYSLNEGASYTNIATISGDDFSGDKTYQNYSYNFPTSISPDTGSKIFIEFVTTKGERMLYDSFTISYGGVSNDPIVSSDITSVSLAAEVGGSANQDIAVDGANLSADITATLSGTDAAQFSITPVSINQSGGNASGSITVTYTASASATTHTAILTLSSTGANDVEISLNGETSEPITTIGNGTKENPYTVADVKILNNSLASSTKYWVKGYIIGVPSGGNGTNLTKVDLEKPFSSSTAIALSDVASEDDLSKMVAVQLPVGAVRENLNLQDTPSNLNKEILVYGTLEGYFSNTPGVKKTSDYVIVITSVSKKSDNGIVLYSSHGQLIVEADESVKIIEIFNAFGQKVAGKAAVKGVNIIPVQKGLLIVKAGNHTAKVLVK